MMSVPLKRASNASCGSVFSQVEKEFTPFARNSALNVSIALCAGLFAPAAPAAGSGLSAGAGSGAAGGADAGAEAAVVGCKDVGTSCARAATCAWCCCTRASASTLIAWAQKNSCKYCKHATFDAHAPLPPFEQEMPPRQLQDPAQHQPAFPFLQLPAEKFSHTTTKKKQKAMTSSFRFNDCRFSASINSAGAPHRDLRVSRLK